MDNAVEVAVVDRLQDLLDAVRRIRLAVELPSDDVLKQLPAGHAAGAEVRSGQGAAGSTGVNRVTGDATGCRGQAGSSRSSGLWYSRRTPGSYHRRLNCSRRVSQRFTSKSNIDM